MWVPGTGGRGGITGGMMRCCDFRRTLVLGKPQLHVSRVTDREGPVGSGSGTGGLGAVAGMWPPHAGSLPCLQQLVGARGSLWCGVAGAGLGGLGKGAAGHRDPSSTRTHQVQSPGRNSSTCRYRTLSTIAPGVRPQPSGTAPLGHPWVAAPSGDRAAASSSSQGDP